MKAAFKLSLLSICIALPFWLCARSADGEYFGIPYRDLDSADVSYDEYKRGHDSGVYDMPYHEFMYGRYLENDFKKVAEKYLDQNLNEAALVNAGIFLLNAQKEYVNLGIMKGGGSLIEMDLDTSMKKAFLMALVRLDLKYMRDAYNGGRGNVIFLYLKVSELFNKSFFEYRLVDRFMFAGDYYRGRFKFQMYERNYDIEINEVLKAANNPDIKSFICEDALNKIDDGEFINQIAKNYRSLNYAQLIEMFDFVKASWGRSLNISAEHLFNYKKAEVGIRLSIERSEALVMALSRARVFATHLYPISVRGPLSDENGISVAIQRETGWTHFFECDFPKIGKYEIGIQNDAEGIVWVKSLDVVGDTRDRLIPNGKYYSPELYNVVLSIFGELARKDFLENSPEKQEAKDE